MVRNMKLLPLFSLLLCVFGLLVAPVTALADPMLYDFTTFAQPYRAFDNSQSDYAGNLSWAADSYAGSTSSSLSHTIYEGSKHVSLNFSSATVPPQWSVQLNSDIHGNFYANKQSDGDYTIDLGQSTALKTYWDYDGVMSATRNETTSGSVSGSVGGATSSGVSNGNGTVTLDYDEAFGLDFNHDLHTGDVLCLVTTSAVPLVPGSRVSFVWSQNYPEYQTWFGNSFIVRFFESAPGTFNAYVSSGVAVSPDSSGYVTVPSGMYRYVSIELTLSGPSASFTRLDAPILVVDDQSVVDAIHQQTQTTIEETQKQTDTLMNTDGSDSIVSGATSGGEQGLLDKLGFIGTVVQVPLSILDGLTSSEESTITFPGISVPLPGGNFVIPETEIDLWENFPALETPVRTGCTFVCVLLWLNGCKSLYDRIVHGDKDVIIEEGSA